jgi:hypothetical protein
MVAGYSGTALNKKLGLREGSAIHAIGAPPDYRALLDPLPMAVRFQQTADRSTDLVHVFETRRERLGATLTRLRKTLGPDAAVWVSWPKKASKVPTTVTEDVIRELALPLGFVDVKVCAVTEVWSGLKLVVRKELRPRKA